MRGRSCWPWSLSRPEHALTRDQEAFLRYLEPHGFYWRNMKVEFRGELREVAAIFYKWLRCELVHEGGLPVDVQFEEDEERLGVRAGGAPAFTLLLTTGWFFKLLDVALLPQVGQQGVNTTT